MFNSLGLEQSFGDTFHCQQLHRCVLISIFISDNQLDLSVSMLCCNLIWVYFQDYVVFPFSSKTLHSVQLWFSGCTGTNKLQILVITAVIEILEVEGLKETMHFFFHPAICTHSNFNFGVFIPIVLYLQRPFESTSYNLFPVKHWIDKMIIFQGCTN